MASRFKFASTTIFLVRFYCFLMCFQAEAFRSSDQLPTASSSPRSFSSSTELHLFGVLKDAKKALVRKLAGEYDSEAVRARIDNLIKTNDVLMLSFTTCPYCIKAKQVLDAKSANYTVVELNEDPAGTAIRAELFDLVGRSSVPAIWIGGEFIGGCNDGPMGGIVQLQEQGKLDDMLKNVGAI
ncbi:hypothetical protein FisN_4Hh086 [Fistulifera solaris]|jgi:glutaredoxin 3|uniref:Glutaredoxin domain-containing protein n=1 Tax=Fistulifera solaris TaxID=1519565 RepID=A0A1Z5KEB6_FISSO|nr:hypothetical protein FisN_4Hh086 [Fistulifera solaris]|eukprot:GAX24567.1 hypothetical protein FisN_4Hh086 [Fistulifera solaris]